MTRRRPRSRSVRGTSMVGTEITVEVGSPGHGGFCVARHEGRAVFVRHTLPGERVVARVTEGGSEDRFWRADAVEIIEASSGRVTPPCPYAGPGLCGGCDWQHATMPTQRQLKGEVVADQLRRLAGLERDVVVEEVPGTGADDGLGWRTRMGYTVDESGRAGLRRHRSHDVVPIDTCLIAHPEIRDAGVEQMGWPSMGAVRASCSGAGELSVVAVPADREDDPHLVEGPATLTEYAAGRSWQVTADGFWQVHPGAADLLVEAVVDGLRPVAGDMVLDLYAGVGLFSGALADRVGAEGGVVAVESSDEAVDDALENLVGLSEESAIIAGDVHEALTDDDAVPEHMDLVVLDPPRTGAKAAVVGEIVTRTPRAVAYVACDPSALARDLATFAAHGYELAELRAFDLFPMTHHVECLAILRPGTDAGQST